MLCRGGALELLLGCCVARAMRELLEASEDELEVARELLLHGSLVRRHALAPLTALQHEQLRASLARKARIVLEQQSEVVRVGSIARVGRIELGDHVGQNPIVPRNYPTTLRHSTQQVRRRRLRHVVWNAKFGGIQVRQHLCYIGKYFV